MKFLHIADVHLGCTRYQLPESPRDFFDAWIDVMKRYGISENVDFVLISGDFFHKRSVPPETMDYAVDGLTMIKEAGIPVIAIEGNHDQKHTDSEFSWLRSLSKWGLIKLLEPESSFGQISYSPWDESKRAGGFLDIGEARIFGSNWYGASGDLAVRMLADAIRENLREGAFHILLLHTDVEGHQTHPLPALSANSLKELKRTVQYVALGHTHKHYEIDNWAFNPGSIEITNISEFRETRGAFVVEVESGKINARHVTDYHYRPFQRLAFDVSNSKEPVDVTSGVLEMIRTEARAAVPDMPRPIVEIGLRGQLGFPNSLLETQNIRDETMAATDALHVRIKNHTVPADYLETRAEEDDEGRERLERRVIDDLITRDTRYTKRKDTVSDAVIGAKRMALTDEPAERIAEFIGIKICPKPSNESVA
jgi:DNA repair protein SbcD/Mre11